MSPMALSCSQRRVTNMSNSDGFFERVGCGALLFLVWQYLFGDGCGCLLVIIAALVLGAGSVAAWSLQ
jgi:hypothetical protein